MNYNYHTHTARCFHAKGTDEEYVISAIEAGYEEIGFADHCPWNFDGDFVSGMRMHKDEFPSYCESVKGLKEKYKDKISIKLGLECEYFPKYFPWLRKKLEEYGVDYIILGHHFSGDEIGGKYNGALRSQSELEIYKNDIISALDENIFSYIAHPDIFMRGYDSFDIKCEEISRAIIEKAVEKKVPLEYNLLGLSHGINDRKPGYPHPSFWKIAAEYKPLTVIGIDAHHPDAYKEKAIYEKAVSDLKNLGLEITDKICFLR